MVNAELAKAIKLLKAKYDVVPEKYTIYNGAYLFLAYPPNEKHKDRCLSPYYLSDPKEKIAGPFSPAFDFDGFFNAIEKLIDI